MTRIGETYCVGSVARKPLRDLNYSVDVIQQSVPAEPEVEPLFRTRTPAEKAARQSRARSPQGRAGWIEICFFLGGGWFVSQGFGAQYICRYFCQLG